MNKPLTFALILILSARSFVQAQSEEMPKLSEPILKRAPSHAQWTVYFPKNRKKGTEAFAKGNPELLLEGASSAPNQLRSLSISKDGKTYLELSEWGDGRRTQKWIVGDLQVYETPYTKQIARAILPSNGQYAPNYSDYRRNDFEELEWVDKTNFKGLKEIDGRKVLEFRVDAAKRRLTPREQSELLSSYEEQASNDSPATGEPVATTSPGFVAYLDPQTQLPLYFDDGNTVRFYKFSETPPASLVVPPQFAAEIERWQKDLNRRRPLPKP